MNPPRVYHPEDLQVGRDLRLTEAASHHLGRVLRVAPGAEVTLFDGSGGEYRATVRSVERGAVRVRCTSFDQVERESTLQLGLAQIVSAGEKMDFCVQKTVELGVAWIQPLSGRRGKVKLIGERAERRIAHWQRIVIAACEQSGRNRIPTVRPLQSLFSWLGEGFDAGESLLLLDPGAGRSLAKIDPPAGKATLLAGGESGFAPEEIEAAVTSRFSPVNLGPRVLRTETAALAALAAMQALWGDL